jgi:phage gp29-like protein
MATRALLSDHLATRARSIDFATLGLLLPNPDPILKAQGKDIATYRDMTHDALIGSCVVRRKSSVQALDFGLDRGQASSRVAKAVQAMLDALPLSTIIEQMQDCTLYGYQPMEIIWGDRAGLWVPQQVLAKPPEWFCFNADNELRFKTKESPLFGIPLEDKKFLLPRKSPTYQNPYGFADLSMCYWPLLFKKGGLKFWLAFVEKFGGAFSIGKLPRSATPEERATLLDSLDALLQNGVATIPDDGSIEMVEMAGKTASADLYEKLVRHCSSEIAIALLGQNQTTQESSNKASATAGLEVAKELRDGDAEIIAAALNQMIAWICEVNFAGAQAPVFSFWDQKAQDTLQASRDKSNYDAGARFTNAYWQRAYGYQEGDLLPESSAAPTLAAPALAAAPGAGTAPAAGPAVFAEAAAAVDPVQAQTDALMRAGAPLWSAMVDQVQALVDKASSLTQLQQDMTAAYGGLDSSELVKLMAAAFALAELKGLDDARTEMLPSAPTVGFAEAPAAPAAPAVQEIHIHPAITIQMPAAPAAPPAPTPVAPAIQIDVHVPAQPAPVVEVHNAVTAQVPPATVVLNHPASSVATVERDPVTMEIIATRTTFSAQ